MSNTDIEYHIPLSSPWLKQVDLKDAIPSESREGGRFLVLPPNVPERIPAAEAKAGLPIIENFIDGANVPSESNWLLKNVNPATGELNGYVRASVAEDGQAAIEAADVAFRKGTWPKMSRSERAAVLESIADLVAENKEELARLETADTGKPLTVSRNVDISRVEENFRYFAAKLRVQETSSSSLRPGNYTRRSPLGVCVLIAPWNLPLYLMTWKIAPCIASGNTCVCKPTELASSTLAKLVALIASDSTIGPKLKGVINVVNGRGQDLGDVLCTHPSVSAISFTGGTATGRRIASLAAPHLKKVSLELGGKNATIIWKDAPIKGARMMPTVIRSAFANSGQICLCGSRILIHEDIYDEFASALVSGASKLKVGDPLDPGTTNGPLVSREHAWRVHNFVLWSLHANPAARVLLGGPEKYDGTAFYPITILEGVDHDFVANKEFFGPVVSLHKFSSEEECIRLANASCYGLAGSLWMQGKSEWDILRLSRAWERKFANLWY
ncbi:hypothetical protein FOZ62_027952 [Perkinsus olseni]|uniref:Aldehyde dehydrogenase domain-containing protein n=2 Tax=Perkinsus olseni TaxID=32597 RepID=A0A7J6QN07_PEROL|nr:hypothetical protein FOZ62_027952 [Perkinsus olseni]